MFSNTQKNHQVYRKYDSNVLTWEETIDNINYSFKKDSHMIQYENLGFFSTQADKIKKCEHIFKKIEEKNKDTRFNFTTAHLYVSFTEKSKTAGKHRDGAFVWYWQCIGKTEWTIYENDEEHIYILSPGDIIYVPRGIYHSVAPLTPRVGVSFGSELNSWDNYDN